MTNKETATKLFAKLNKDNKYRLLYDENKILVTDHEYAIYIPFSSWKGLLDYLTRLKKAIKAMSLTKVNVDNKLYYLFNLFVNPPYIPKNDNDQATETRDPSPTRTKETDNSEK